MGIVLGLIGPADSIEVVQHHLKKYTDMTCVSFECVTEADLNERVMPRKNEVDMWLCTGPITYDIVQGWGELSDPIFFIHVYSSALSSLLLQLSHEHHIQVEEISFDAISLIELKQVLREANIQPSVRYIESDKIELSELADFHRECHEKGATRAVITGHPIKEQLESLGIPVFRILPTEVSVDTAVYEIRRVEEMMHIQRAQIAVQIIEYDVAFQELKNTAFTTDTLYKMEHEYMNRLHVYTEKVHGSILSLGTGRYAIFSTRGFLQDITHNFTHRAEIDVSEEWKEEVETCGIGIGQSAKEAEVNAWNALLQSREWGKGSWAVCFDDKSITGPLGQEKQLSYSYKTEGLNSIKKKTSLSVTTLHKLKSIITKRRSEEISANELAQYMQITIRSARRILGELEANGLAAVVAEESPRATGRPRKVYKLLL